MHEFVEIYWGDGNVEWADCPRVGGCSATVTHTYAAPGTYTISVIATACPTFISRAGS